MSATASRARPWLSAITVCFNAKGTLAATVQSLRAQQVPGVEWVVVDGASTDGSADWLRAQQPDRFLSEPDRGIYDAMNKAIDLATGDWLFFLNAGDAFADAQALADVRASTGPRNRGCSATCAGRQCSCGGALMQRLVKFAVSLHYNADFNWVLRPFLAGARLHHLRRDIALFGDAGARR